MVKAAMGVLAFAGLIVLQTSLLAKESDGAMHVPEFDLSFSSLLSEEAREAPAR